MKLNRTTLLISSAIGALLARSPAFAGEDDGPRPNVSTVEEIVVTAQKREQTLIDIPQAISVVSGGTLETQQATSFSDYLKLVPGLQLSQATPGQGRLVMRGVNTGGVASTVAVYMDETPFGSSSALVNGAVLAGDFDTFDVARIEVLRGPQGTLYGASSMGGLLKFVTNTPDFGGYAARGRISVEDTKGGDLSYRTTAMVNIPLSQTVALRASGFYRKDGGFIDSIGTSGSDVENDINDAKVYGGRASLLFKPNDAFDLRLTAMLQDIKADGPTEVESDPDTLKTLYGRPTLSQYVPTVSDVAYRVYNGVLNYDLGFATLTASSSYTKQNQTKRDDATFNLSGLIEAVFGAPNDLYLGQKTNNRKYTQELRLASNAGAPFEWLVGGYFTDEKGLVHQEYIAVTPGSLTQLTGLPLLADLDLNSRYKEYAGFANATLHLGERIDVDVGGRYSHNKQTASQAASGVLAGGVPVNSNLKSSDNVFTYSLAPKFKFDEHRSIYGRVAKGYRPGGPNVIPPGAPAGTPSSFAPDKVTSYEAGFKGESADHRLSLDVAAYHIDWKGIQLLTVVNNFGINANGADATSDGIEFNASARLAKGLTLSANGAYTNAKLDGDTSDLVGGKKGDQLPFTPKLSLGFNGDYSWSIGDHQAYVGASLRVMGKQSGSFDADYRAAHGQQRKLSSYEVVDLRAGITVGRVDIEAYVKNLTDADGKTSTSSTTANGLPIYPGGAIGTGMIRPRTIGVSLTAGF
ncbi:TonB-dependent receptor [Caulobacter sp.]|uniref:TonB-dependent receptor n=1 Tax=Caulobacter sp. TaxID=78 RepID=UPI002B48F00D|nr:TonB-dependent receptor [Caulobacter sp.]HJV41398.1 TonB-dependent receptor [Caulobacter sp.]